MQENYDVYVLADANNRVKSIEGTAFYTPEELTAKGYVKIDSGVGDKFMHCQNNYLPKPIMTMQGIPQYKLFDGKVVERTQKEIDADIAKIPPPPPDPLVVTQKAATVMFRALAQTDVITPADALDNAVMFPLWDERIGTDTKVGEYMRHDNGLYRVKQAHTIQEHYPPSTATASLYSKVTMPGEILDWTPGSWDIDVKVKHNGKIWLSMVKDNTWEPGSIGVYDNIWKEVS